MTIKINTELRRDITVIVIACLTVFLAILATRLVPIQVHRTEWITTASELPPLETSVVAMYLVEMPDGSVKRWEINVVRAVANIDGFLEELWLIDRPEAGVDLGRPTRWKQIDDSNFEDKKVSYKDIELFYINDKSSLWTY